MQKQSVKYLMSFIAGALCVGMLWLAEARFGIFSSHSQNLPPAISLEEGENLLDFLPDTSFRTESGWYGWDSSPFALKTPFFVKMRFERKSGGFPAISLSGRINTEGEWWRGIHRMYVIAQRNRVSLEFRDGRSETIKADVSLSPSIRPQDGFAIAFLDPHGKAFDVLDKEGHVVAHYEISAIPGIKMPKGLFPDGLLYVGVLVSPNTGMEIYELSMGKYETQK